MQYINMDFYSLIEKAEFRELIKEAKKSCVKDALTKLREFEPVNENFLKALLPEDTPEVLIKKRASKTNKLRMKRIEKDLKRLFG